MVMNVVTNPVEALVEVGKENSQLHEELAKCYAELDKYRAALQKIVTHPGIPGTIARKVLAQKATN